MPTDDFNREKTLRDLGVLEIAGTVAKDELRRLNSKRINSKLSQDYKRHRIWFYLNNLPPGTAPCGIYERAFGFTAAGAVVPLPEGQFELLEICEAPRDFVESSSAKGKSLRAVASDPDSLLLGLFQLPLSAKTGTFTGRYEPSYWGWPGFCLGSPLSMHQLVWASPDPDLSFLQSYLTHLAQWGDIQMGQSTVRFEIHPVPEGLPEERWMYYRNGPYQLEKLKPYAWATLLGSVLAQPYKITGPQIDQLLSYLRRWWDGEPSQVWEVQLEKLEPERRVKFDSLPRVTGLVRDIFCSVLVFEVAGKQYWLYLGWSD